MKNEVQGLNKSKKAGDFFLHIDGTLHKLQKMFISRM